MYRGQKEVRVKTLRLGNSIVLDPESGPSSAVVVYGGLHGWQGEWLVPEIPEYLRRSVIFVLPRDFRNDCNACLKELHRKISPENITSYSLCGYSRGGVEVYRYRNLAQWKILGLIDPTAPTMGGFRETVLDSVSYKIRCVYWVPNWGKDGYGDHGRQDDLLRQGNRFRPAPPLEVHSEVCESTP